MATKRKSKRAAKWDVEFVKQAEMARRKKRKSMTTPGLHDAHELVEIEDHACYWNDRKQINEEMYLARCRCGWESRMQESEKLARTAFHHHIMQAVARAA